MVDSQKERIEEYEKTKQKMYGIFALSILVCFVFFYTRHDYTMAVSGDGYWEIYLIPDTYGYIGGYLVYKGDILQMESKTYGIKTKQKR